MEIVFNFIKKSLKNYLGQKKSTLKFLHKNPFKTEYDQKKNHQKTEIAFNFIEEIPLKSIYPPWGIGYSIPFGG